MARYSMGSFALLTSLLCVLQMRRVQACTAVSNSTVSFNITLTWEEWSVAGKTRQMILTNGQFPAPTLCLEQGSNVEFLVTNSLPFSTTVHFHGESP